MHLHELREEGRGAAQGGVGHQRLQLARQLRGHEGGAGRQDAQQGSGETAADGAAARRWDACLVLVVKLCRRARNGARPATTATLACNQPLPAPHSPQTRPVRSACASAAAARCRLGRGWQVGPPLPPLQSRPWSWQAWQGLSRPRAAAAPTARAAGAWRRRLPAPPRLLRRPGSLRRCRRCA